MTSAFGKAILAGEHAVVYGHPAVAVALDRGVSCEARRSDEKSSSVVAPIWDLEASAGDGSPLGRVLSEVQKDIAGDIPLSYQIEAQIPAGSGLGSSAALSVAILRATRETLSLPLSNEAVVEVANRLERQFHDRPSGIDVALSANGGAMVFQKGEENTRIDASWLSLVVADTGEPRSTRDMIRRVATQMPGAGSWLTDMGEAARYAGEAVRRRDVDQLGAAMMICQDRLARLGLVTDGLDELCKTAMDAGAKAAKMTGGGGGGAIIAFAPGNEENVRQALLSRAKDAFVCRIATLSPR